MERTENTNYAEETGIKKPDKILGIRHLQVLLLLTAMSVAFGMRANMSVAIVAMTDANSTLTHVPRFPEWSKQIQDMILSSFFWGYILMQIPSGMIVQRFGEKVLLTTAIAVNSLVSFLIPVAATGWGWQGVCACRALQGFTQASIFPCVYGLLAKWMPISERSRLSTYVIAGASLGTILELSLSGLIDEKFGWPMIFYSAGIVGLVWTMFWVFLGSDTPGKYRWISKQERMYIEESSGYSKKTGKIPWRSIFTSTPFWALLAVQAGQDWGFYTLFTETPSYLSNVLGVNITTNGILSALPHVALYLFSLVFCNLADYLINNNVIGRTRTRKMFNSIAQWGAAFFLIALCYAPHGNLAVAVLLLTLAMGISSGGFVGSAINHIELSPNFAPIIMGIANTTANIMSLLAPLAVGFILKDETQASEWRLVFYIAAAFYFFGNLAFVVFGTAEKQSWNESNEDDSSR